MLNDSLLKFDGLATLLPRCVGVAILKSQFTIMARQKYHLLLKLFPLFSMKCSVGVKYYEDFSSSSVS